MKKNKLICGDNLAILATIPSEFVDLIYIDPPFFSNRNYEIIWGDEAEIRSFEDRWEGGINVYIDWMKQRIIELHRILKPSGTFYIHCDWHAGHYLKVMCDEVFGYTQFKNEIVWCYRGGGVPKKDFAKKHDTIFRYVKSDNYIFNIDEVRIPYSEDVLGSLPSRYDKSYRDNKTYEGYRPNPKGKHPEDWWLIQPLMPSDKKERLGYPTQKPEALLTRIITASSNKGDLILDAFCGCGTALAVAQKWNRRWIGVDISPSAISLIKIRLGRIGVAEKAIDIIGMPQKPEDLLRFKPFEFQYWVINELHGSPSPRRTGDMGIDGFSFLNHYPIQVKQSESVGRNVVDNFETALRRYYAGHKGEMNGYIIAFSFGKGAREEVATAKKEGFRIELITVKDILDKRVNIRQSATPLFHEE